MPAKLSIHLPGQAVVVRVLRDDGEFVLGRDADVDVRVEHDSVSRRHARLQGDAAGWHIVDLGSKNGTRVEGAKTVEATLPQNAWFALGDVFCEFERIDAAAEARLEARAAERRSSSLAWATRLERRAQSSTRLIGDLLRGIVDIAECERGFLLAYDADRALVLRACYAFRPEEIDGRSFSGSRGAVDRALLYRKPVFSSDPHVRAWLGEQPSVVAQGLRAIACLPMQYRGDVLGIAYADTSDEAKVFTQLDAELLGAYVDRAATALAMAALDAALDDLSTLLAVDQASVDEIGVAPRWSPPPKEARA
ncbi:MAG: FHA domain-containing protein [Dokdonella sp.]|uniref:FHA domain-containing protein n=1 Tax=Dokdonella sp. TaxID=2291710 RepID=UPI003F82209D